MVLPVEEFKNKSYDIKVSELDDVYSLSSKVTCAEFSKMIPNYMSEIYQVHGELLHHLDLSTGKPLDHLIFYRRECPLCDSHDFRFLFAKHGFDHMICDHCGAVFTLQVLSPRKAQHLEECGQGNLYGEYKDKSLVSDLDKKKFEISFSKISEFGSVKEIFDIGSNAGKFLEWASRDYRVEGHEYHDYLRKVSTDRGHLVHHDDLSSIKLDRNFDLITCWDYLDHIIDPKESLSNLSNQVNSGAMFFFAINNIDSLSARILHQNSPIFIGPHHVTHYGVRQLDMLMSSLGWELVYVESYVSELNWISNWLQFKNPEFGDAELMYDLFDPKDICKKGLGFKLNVLFKKL